ncbi:galactose-specific lectin nattectin-like [Denticeps clupeoides]|uniref:galactose-specific lectin nattectin-like n=1 Tax=Denticeps clupeoides TaxID=299321 RepID=UPI0010A59835|nr:galactose-specific lectin nattectin-like [Denticeps clupeoides]
MTMLRILLVCCIAFMPMIKADTAWSIYGSRYFKVVTAPKDWNSAELDCQNQGGNLASIHSAEEHAFLVSLVKTVGNINVWIGRSDAVKEGSWIWSDGRKSQISKWGPGEPNNAGNGEHCAELFVPHGFLWNDSICSLAKPYVCAKNV